MILEKACWYLNSTARQIQPSLQCSFKPVRGMHSISLSCVQAWVVTYYTKVFSGNTAKASVFDDLGWWLYTRHTEWKASGPWGDILWIWQKVYWIIIVDYTFKPNFPIWHRSINQSLRENFQTFSGGAHRKSMERCKRVQAHPEFTEVWTDTKKCLRDKNVARNVCLYWTALMKTQKNNNNAVSTCEHVDSSGVAYSLSTETNSFFFLSLPWRQGSYQRDK